LVKCIGPLKNIIQLYLSLAQNQLEIKELSDCLRAVRNLHVLVSNQEQCAVWAFVVMGTGISQEPFGWGV